MEKITNSTLYERGGVWYVDANIIKNGKNKRLRFSTAVKVSEMKKQDEKYAALKANKNELIRLYLKGQKKKFKNLLQTYQRKDNLLFKNVCKKFLNELTDLKPNSKNTVIERLRLSLSFFEYQNITDINKEEIEKFFNFLDDKNLSATTKKHYAKTLNRVLNYALENDLITKNPFKLRRWKNQNKEIQAFTNEQIKQILTKAKGEIGIYLKIGLLCGARTGEILALQWKHIDLKQGKINITQSISEEGLSTCKTLNSHRLIDCLPLLLDFLKDLKEQRQANEEDFIFQGVLKPYIKNFHKSFLKVQYINLLTKLNIPYRPIYNTRHSFASFMLSKGENIMWVSWMMGHKNTNITLSFYAKYIPSGSHAEFLNDFIGGRK